MVTWIPSRGGTWIASGIYLKFSVLAPSLIFGDLDTAVSYKHKINVVAITRARCSCFIGLCQCFHCLTACGYYFRDLFYVYIFIFLYGLSFQRILCPNTTFRVHFLSIFRLFYCISVTTSIYFGLFFCRFLGHFIHFWSQLFLYRYYVYYFRYFGIKMQDFFILLSLFRYIFVNVLLTLCRLGVHTFILCPNVHSLFFLCCYSVIYQAILCPHPSNICFMRFGHLRCVQIFHFSVFMT